MHVYAFTTVDGLNTEPLPPGSVIEVIATSSSGQEVGTQSQHRLTRCATWDQDSQRSHPAAADAPGAALIIVHRLLVDRLHLHRPSTITPSYAHLCNQTHTHARAHTHILTNSSTNTHLNACCRSAPLLTRTASSGCVRCPLAHTLSAPTTSSLCFQRSDGVGRGPPAAEA
jgi:hypothetical protein